MRFPRISLHVVGLLVASLLLLSACAPAANEAEEAAVIDDRVEGDSNAAEVESGTTSGSVQEIDQSMLVVNDMVLVINDSTDFSEPAEVGDEVSVDYITDENGNLNAETVKVTSKASAAEAEPTEEEIEY
jgi:hypothetical protein